MVIVSQDSNTMITIKDFNSFELVKVDLDYEFYTDKNGYKMARLTNWEYVFYINNKRFASYPKDLDHLAFDLRDKLIESLKNNDKIFQFMRV